MGRIARRSPENADYIYGKRRLREIDRRVRFLIKRLESAQVVHSAGRETDQVFFGATVKIRTHTETREITIVGVDEADPARGQVSWISMAKALLKAREGDVRRCAARPGKNKSKSWR